MVTHHINYCLWYIKSCLDEHTSKRPSFYVIIKLYINFCLSNDKIWLLCVFADTQLNNHFTRLSITPSRITCQVTWKVLRNFYNFQLLITHTLMFQDLVIRCSVYNNIIGLPAKHCFCTKIIHYYY